MRIFERFMTNAIIAYSVILIILPVRLFKVAHYNVEMGYIAIGTLAIILPAIILLSKSYINNSTTIIVWCLRALMALIFLVAGFKYGITGTDLVSFCGTIIITFFYEMGYFVVKSGRIEFFLRMMAWASTILCIYLLFVLIPLVYKYRVLVAYMPIVRDNYNYYFPNALGIFLVLIILIVLYLAKTNKAYLLTLLAIFPTLILTFSRSALAALGIVVFFLFLKKRKNDLGRMLRALILGAIVVALFVGINEAKEKSSGSIRGAKIEHSFKRRLSRWSSIFSVCKEAPFLGLGFRSAAKNLPTFESYEGDIAKLHSAHNDYMDILLRGGVIYSAMFWSFVILVVRRGFKARTRNKELLRYISFSIVALLLAATNQDVLKGPLTASFFWIYIAAIGHFTDKRACMKKSFELKLAR